MIDITDVQRCITIIIYSNNRTNTNNRSKVILMITNPWQGKEIRLISFVATVVTRVGYVYYRQLSYSKPGLVLRLHSSRLCLLRSWPAHCIIPCIMLLSHQYAELFV